MSRASTGIRAAPSPARHPAEAAPAWVVPLSDIEVDRELEEAVLGVLRSGWWSMGPVVEQLERELAAFCGVAHALAVANGSAALHLALLAVGCGPGDEVVVPSLSFVAAANAIVHTGATPVFCDVVGPDDLTTSPDDVEAALGPATRAIVVMHYGGYPCAMDRILELARARGIAVVEDAAHAPGARWRGKACGAIGDVGCFSFFANKNLPTGEGGMVVTDDDALAERMRLLRSHGMTTLTWDRHRGHAHAYDVVEHGFNYRLDELRAAIGLVELGRLAAANNARARVSELYRAALDGTAGLRVPFVPSPQVVPAHHLAVVLLPEGRERDGFRAALAARGVQTSVHYPPIHRFSRYRALGAARPLPVTDAVAPRLVTLPLYPSLSVERASLVVDAVLAAL
ncbi:MAG: DegT/DnrJ/EryC1/StrS family aminotransferase [Thermoleophilia bacterium]|nr:DegT/DnrJ/EryC1/StrS family aminotransferase [Thermoleophilia bacterium]